jgi:hypothetical protein
MILAAYGRPRSGLCTQRKLHIKALSRYRTRIFTGKTRLRPLSLLPSLRLLFDADQSAVISLDYSAALNYAARAPRQIAALHGGTYAVVADTAGMGSGFRAGFSLLLPRSLSLSLSLCLSQTHTHLHTHTHTHTHPTLSLLDSGTPLLLRRKRKRQQTCREGASSRRFQHRTSLSMKRHRLPTPRNERSPRC